MIKTYDFPNLYHNIVGDVVRINPKNYLKAITEYDDLQIYFNNLKSQPKLEKSQKTIIKTINQIQVKSKRKQIVRRTKLYKTMGLQKQNLKNKKQFDEAGTQTKNIFRNYLKKSNKQLPVNIRNSNGDDLREGLQDAREISIKTASCSSEGDQFSQGNANQIKETLDNIKQLLPQNNRKNISKRKNLSSFVNFYRKSELQKENEPSKVIKSNFKIKSKVTIGSQKSQNDSEVLLQKFKVLRPELKKATINKKKNVQFTEAYIPLSSVQNTQNKQQILVSRKSNKKLKKSTRFRNSKIKIEQLLGGSSSQSNQWTQKSMLSLKFDRQSLTKSQKQPQYQREFMESYKQYNRQIKMARNKYNTKTKRYIPLIQPEKLKFVSMKDHFQDKQKIQTIKKKRLMKKTTLLTSMTSIKSKTSIKRQQKYERKKTKKVTFNNHELKYISQNYFSTDNLKGQQEQNCLASYKQYQNSYYKKNLTLRKLKSLEKQLECGQKLNVFDELNYFNIFINENYSDVSSQQNEKCMVKPMVINNEIKTKQLIDYAKIKKQNMLIDMSKAITKNHFSLAQKRL